MFDAWNKANSKGCYIDNLANLHCSGTVTGVVPINGGQSKVALSAIESPKNWFEDFGSGRLSNGSTVVTLDPEYGQTVNTELEYHVFLTPNGDCKGLYVSHRTATSFEVHEIGGGTSNIEFSYRVVALRRNFENIRLGDRTNDRDAIERMMAKTGAPFRFETPKVKLPERPDAPTPHPVPQIRRPAEIGKPAQALK